MPDIAVRHIDDAMVERIKEIARARKWSINDVILHALRSGLGLGGENLGGEREFQNMATLSSAWQDEESAVLQEAIEAMGSVPDGQLARKYDEAKPPAGKKKQ